MKNLKFFFIGVAVITIIALLAGCGEPSAATSIGSVPGTLYEFTHEGVRCIMVARGGGTGLACDFNSVP